MKRSIQFLSVVIMSLTVLSAFAAKKPIMTADPKDVAVQVQNFPISDPANVTIQLRYVDKKIKYFAFRNNSSKVLKITMFEVAHELKPTEDLSINAPDVENIVVELETYNPEAVNSVKKLAPSKVYLFKRQADGIFVLYSTY